MIEDLMTCHLLLDDLSPSTSQPCAASGRRILIINIHIYDNRSNRISINNIIKIRIIIIFIFFLVLAFVFNRCAHSAGPISDNTIASRIPAARPQGSLFAVPGLRSLCVRKLHSPAEEDDEGKQ